MQGFQRTKHKMQESLQKVEENLQRLARVKTGEHSFMNGITKKESKIKKEEAGRE
jgi:hypothetical protein